ncbi:MULTISPECIES: TetR/AcrR family transcriptional regulator [Arthrobacter]|uniref:TetR/AcrR family transcriptional regulator n=1 Tax=Arthrobacter terricola TaxID=2547396 RepID=A0A4R5K8H1_9MICC|nr:MULTISPECIES: TetR/AcrR family transcriptional regulator [Arthrobacter]MBT8163735.1 TetR/AcrR family transcriptional regulator [Arthrobacter sp. GN70]TDF87202.1 TetR/AcrR family transcriptional regulator [Arthrobacter terricola]
MSGKAGQGRKFNVEDALEAATLVFWDHGYEGASLSELTHAMGINPPSLYKAFGSKEDLFFSVVDHYNATHGNFMSIAFAEEATGLALMRRLLLEAAEHYASTSYPGGCLVISAAVTVTSANRHVGDRLAKMRNDNIAAMAEALTRDLNAGLLPQNTDTKAMAAFVGATLQGMSQQARDGATKADLTRIANYAITAIGA